MNDSLGKKTGKLSDKMMQNKSEWGEQETFSGNPTIAVCEGFAFIDEIFLPSWEKIDLFILLLCRVSPYSPSKDRDDVEIYFFGLRKCGDRNERLSLGSCLELPCSEKGNKISCIESFHVSACGRFLRFTVLDFQEWKLS